MRQDYASLRSAAKSEMRGFLTSLGMTSVEGKAGVGASGYTSLRSAAKSEVRGFLTSLGMTSVEVKAGGGVFRVRGGGR